MVKSTAAVAGGDVESSSFSVDCVVRCVMRTMRRPDDPVSLSLSHSKSKPSSNLHFLPFHFSPCPLFLFSFSSLSFPSRLSKVNFLSIVYLCVCVRVRVVVLVTNSAVCVCAGLALCAVVSLRSIEIFRTHEWLKATSTVYFRCQGENATVLLDIKKPHLLYAFNGQESWQPLSSFSSEKCKRCGLYEEDSITLDDTLEEWKFCPSDFTALDGEYIRFKEKEFNATFLCPECLSIAGVAEHDDGKGMHIAVVVLLSGLVSIILILGVVGAYKFWQKKIREQDQARLLKLFEYDDDTGDELDLGSVI
ncbi:hypothetical protein Fmac_027694 [Flemingia macrophylla]|uniref:DUF7953 domain-containing protein n=1 Tax=Flemingia macrophylla TaxID=520843 RepID=A0ABD1LK23_9FABA